jgi:RNA polymerase sigma-70 factor (ECF subfamily)
LLAKRYGADLIELSLPNSHQTNKYSHGLITNTDDNDLVRRLQLGDAKAFESIYNMYFDRLYAFVFHSVNRDRATAEDIVQDTFISAIRSVKGFKGQSKLYTWLIGIARHKIMDYYRHEQKRNNHHVNTNVDPIDLQLIVDTSQAIPESIETSETRLDVEKALSALPADYQYALRFKYVEEMTISEISQVVNRSPKAIEGLLTRARKIFGDYYKEIEEGITWRPSSKSTKTSLRSSAGG